MAHELHTTDSLTYNFFPLTRGSLKFSIKANNDAHIALTTGRSEDEPIYEIMIGGWANTKSVLRRNRAKPEKASADTPNILSGDKTREFWIKWLDGSIMVGRAGGSDPFLSYWDPDPFPIGYYGVRTAYGSTGEWLIEGARSIATPNQLKYNFWPLPSGGLTFDVRCPSNAHIELISSRTPDKYENSSRIQIAIGGWDNTQSVIRRDGVSLFRTSVPTPGIVVDWEFRRFKILWKNGSLSVSRGSEGSKALLEYHDPDHVGVTYYGLRTAHGATGDWKIIDEDHPHFGHGYGTSKYEWKAACNGIPPEAFVGGNDCKIILYVGRAYYKGALLPGKVNPKHNLCYVSLDGQLNSSNEFQVLIGKDLEWIPTSESHIPCDAVIGGFNEDDETLYVGRVHLEGNTIIGKVQRSRGLCYIHYSGKQLSLKNYEILVTKVK